MLIAGLAIVSAGALGTSYADAHGILERSRETNEVEIHRSLGDHSEDRVVRILGSNVSTTATSTIVHLSGRNRGRGNHFITVPGTGTTTPQILRVHEVRHFREGIELDDDDFITVGTSTIQVFDRHGGREDREDREDRGRGRGRR